MHGTPVWVIKDGKIISEKPWAEIRHTGVSRCPGLVIAFAATAGSRLPPG